MSLGKLQRLAHQTPKSQKEKHSGAEGIDYDGLCRLELGALKAVYPRREAFDWELQVLDHYLLAWYRKEWPPS